MLDPVNGRQSESVALPDLPQEWTVQRVALATLVTLAIAFGFFLLYQFYMIVFLFFVAVTVAIAIRPIVDWLKARGLKEGIGVTVVYALLLGGVVALVWFVGPLLVEQINTLVAQLPEYYSQLRMALTNSGNRLLQQIVRTLPLVPTLSFTGVAGSTAAIAPQDTSPFAIFAPAWEFIRTSGYVTFVFGAVMLLAFNWTLEGEFLTRRMLLFIPINRRDPVRSLMTEMTGTIGSYFRGQAILCAIVGLLSLIGYWAIGLPYALGLALAMTICEAIPMVGPTLGAIPAVLVALSASPVLVPWVLGVVIIIQVLENNLLVPRVMNESVGVNPIVSILSIAAFGALFGFGGAVLAIPLAAMLQIVLNRLFFRLPSVEEPMAMAELADLPQRNLASKIRLQTQELVLDVRNSLRTNEDNNVETEVEQIEDNLEAIASDLDLLLARAEQPA